MASIFDKFIGIMGFGDDDMDDDYSSEQIMDDYPDKTQNKFRNNNLRDSGIRENAPRDTFSRDMAVREIPTKRKSAR